MGHTFHFPANIFATGNQSAHLLGRYAAAGRHTPDTGVIEQRRVSSLGPGHGVQDAEESWDAGDQGLLVRDVSGKLGQSIEHFRRGQPAHGPEVASEFVEREAPSHG